MRHPPEASEQGVEFDLLALEQQMRTEPELAQNGHTARTLVRLPDLRVVLIVMSAGSRMAEHVALETATVQVLSGKLRLELPERALELPAGHLLMLQARVRHEVVALADSVFVLTLGRVPDKP